MSVIRLADSIGELNFAMFTLVSDICPLMLHAPTVNASRKHQPTGLLLLLPVSQKGVKLVKVPRAQSFAVSSRREWRKDGFIG